MSLLLSCSVQKQNQRKYLGKPIAPVVEAWGQPGYTEELPDGNVLAVYIRKVVVRETPIDPGRHSQQDLTTKGFIRYERHSFTLNDAQVVVDYEYATTIEK